MTEASQIKEFHPDVITISEAGRPDAFVLGLNVPDTGARYDFEIPIIDAVPLISSILCHIQASLDRLVPGEIRAIHEHAARTQAVQQPVADSLHFSEDQTLAGLELGFARLLFRLNSRPQIQGPKE